MVLLRASMIHHVAGFMSIINIIPASRVYGLLALPFITLGMEKSIYDTVQAWQGIDPNVRPADRGGFPSGGAALPSFSLIPVQKIKRWVTKPLEPSVTKPKIHCN